MTEASIATALGSRTAFAVSLALVMSAAEAAAGPWHGRDGILRAGQMLGACVTLVCATVAPWGVMPALVGAVFAGVCHAIRLSGRARGARMGWETGMAVVLGAGCALAGPIMPLLRPDQPAFGRLGTLLWVAGLAVMTGLLPLSAVAGRPGPDPARWIVGLVLLPALAGGHGDPAMLRDACVCFGGCALWLDAARARSGTAGAKVVLDLAFVTLGFVPVAPGPAQMAAAGFVAVALLARPGDGHPALACVSRLALALAPPFPAFAALLVLVGLAASWSGWAVAGLLGGALLAVARSRPVQAPTTGGTAGLAAWGAVVVLCLVGLCALIWMGAKV